MNSRVFILTPVFAAQVLAVACRTADDSSAHLDSTSRRAIEDTLRALADSLSAAENSLQVDRTGRFDDPQEKMIGVFGAELMQVSADSLRQIRKAAYESAKSFHTEYDSVFARALTPTVGTIVFRFRERAELRNGTEERMRGKVTVVVVRRPEGWRIAQFHTTLEPDTANSRKR